MGFKEHATRFNLAISVVNGGYVIHALTTEMTDDEMYWTTSVYGDLDNAVEYVKRVLLAFEGPGEEADLQELNEIS